MPATKKILIGTRASKLALAQAQEVKSLIISTNPQYKDQPNLISIVTFKTTGDKVLDQSLVQIGGKGLFVKEIEEALLEKKVDIAVHSMKDIPAFFNEKLSIFAVPKREDHRDAFISNQYLSISHLPIGATIGTSSPRRTALILNQRPDLKVVNFRGNIETRLEKLKLKQVEATILAIAGLNRLSMQNYIQSIFSEEEMLPAVGQGALAVQARNIDIWIIDILEKINHPVSKICTDAERSFLKTINGSCKTPLGAYCSIDNNKLQLKALLASLDGQTIYQTTRYGNCQDAIAIGEDAGKEIKKNGSHILNFL